MTIATTDTAAEFCIDVPAAMRKDAAAMAGLRSYQTTIDTVWAASQAEPITAEGLSAVRQYCAGIAVKMRAAVEDWLAWNTLEGCATRVAQMRTWLAENPERWDCEHEGQYEELATREARLVELCVKHLRIYGYTVSRGETHEEGLQI